MGATNEQKRAYDARLREALASDPQHSMHGTTTAYRAGCRCTGEGSCTQVHARDALRRRYARDAAAV